MAKFDPFFAFFSGFAVGIYTTNSPEACQYVAENCRANIIVVENHKQLQKILQVRSMSDTQHINTVERITMNGDPNTNKVYMLKSFWKSVFCGITPF